MKVKIYHEEPFNELRIILYEENNGKKYIVKPMKMVVEEYREGQYTEPSLRISGATATEFMQEMANEIKTQGIRTDIDKINEGSLVATKYHLEDLRKLLKLK